LPAASRLTARTSVGEQVQGVYIEHRRNAFHGLEREISFAAFQAAHVRTVHAKHEGEGFLAKAASIPDRAQIAAHGSL
jgi:hypothetical protein